MRNIIFCFLLVLLSENVFSQVGINTETPKVTLDVAGTPDDVTKTDGISAPRLKGSELKAKDALYTADQTGAFVYVTEALASEDTTTKTTNVTSVGYYYFDGSLWQAGSVTSDNGLTKTENNIQLGGTLITPTTIGTSESNTLKITGLQTASSGDNILMIGNDGTVKQTSRIKGALDITYYIQGTTELTINQGTRADVPGVTFSHTVPDTLPSQTLIFTVTGYAGKSGNTDGSGQGVFELYQGDTKLTSAYVSVATGNGVNTPLLNLPVPCTMLKSVTLTPGTYNFKVAFKAWAANLIVNKNPTTYSGYDGDTESMLTKMHVAVFNN